MDSLNQNTLADSIFEGLNSQQREAVETTEGPLLVLAGAGSGKTRVLTARIAYLIGVCGIPADQILAVTFTNKAAGEMKERVEKLLGPRAGEISIGTFHSIGVRILRRDIGHLARSRGFVIYDDADSIGVIKEVLKREGIDPKVHDARPSALPPAASISAAVATAPAPFLSAQVTLAPLWAKRCAVSLPMPDAAPLTSAALPSKLNIFDTLPCYDQDEQNNADAPIELPRRLVAARQENTQHVQPNRNHHQVSAPAMQLAQQPERHVSSQPLDIDGSPAR